MVKSDYHFISGKEFIKYLSKNYGLEIISQKGSHIKIKCLGIKTIIPNHKVIAYGTFSGILGQIGIDETEFLDFINKGKK
ncbi:MAG: type II toxin-antitoxin system HicA family toxin [Candidatus Gracilibacteria bacterium]|nr:type II toxin-antitoxin system HicA family toxin [Candidatus Gracilibacteria bacterium]MDQ7022353.1 type II toxin-antitoxin system HicA family toxin [Candidatus Gracilibacteria bacterium]